MNPVVRRYLTVLLYILAFMISFYAFNHVHAYVGVVLLLIVIGVLLNSIFKPTKKTEE